MSKNRLKYRGGVRVSTQRRDYAKEYQDFMQQLSYYGAPNGSSTTQVGVSKPTTETTSDYVIKLSDRSAPIGQRR